MERDLHQSNSARDREEDAPEPPQIRRFRRLVSLTMVAMMVGMLGIMGALVWKLTEAPSRASDPVISGQIDLPAGFEVINISRSGSSLFLILKNTTTDARLLVERDAETQRLIGRYQLHKANK